MSDSLKAMQEIAAGAELIADAGSDLARVEVMAQFIDLVAENVVPIVDDAYDSLIRTAETLAEDQDSANTADEAESDQVTSEALITSLRDVLSTLVGASARLWPYASLAPLFFGYSEGVAALKDAEDRIAHLSSLAARGDDLRRKSEQVAVTMRKLQRLADGATQLQALIEFAIAAPSNEENARAEALLLATRLKGETANDPDV